MVIKLFLFFSTSASNSSISQQPLKLVVIKAKTNMELNDIKPTRCTKKLKTVAYVVVHEPGSITLQSVHLLDGYLCFFAGHVLFSGGGGLK